MQKNKSYKKNLSIFLPNDNFVHVKRKLKIYRKKKKIFKMNLPIILLYSFLLLASCTKLEFMAEDGVLVLNSSNYKKARQIPNLAIFYYNSNRDCKKLLPVLYQLVDQLRSFKPIIYVGKVDGDNETDIIDKEKISKFPYLKVFTSDGRELNYDGMNSIDSLVGFIKRKVKLPIGTSYHLANFKDIENFIAKNKIVVMYFGKSDTNEFKLFVRLSEKKKGHYLFGHSFNAEIRNLNEYDLEWDDTPQMIIFNDYKGKNMTYFGEWSEQKVSQFIRDHTTTNFIKINPDKWNYLMNDRNDSFLFLLINDAKSHDVELEEFQRLAKNLTNKIASASVALKDKENVKIYRTILEVVDVRQENIPALVLVDRLNEKIKIKYSDFKEEIDFVKGLKLFEEWAEENDLFQEKKKEENEIYKWGTVKSLNESNFDEIVYDKNKDVVVIFWSKDLKSLKEIKSKFIDYSEKFKENQNLVFAELNLDKNTVEGLELEGNSEKVVFYPSKSKKKNVELLSNVKNEKKFITFLKKQTSFDWKEPIAIEKIKDEL